MPTHRLRLVLALVAGLALIAASLAAALQLRSHRRSPAESARDGAGPDAAPTEAGVDASAVESEGPVRLARDPRNPCAGASASLDVDAVARALLLPDYDESSKLVRGRYTDGGADPETFTVVPCHGEPVATMPDDPVLRGERAEGTIASERWPVPEAAARNAGAEAGWVVRVKVGGRPGICGTSEGFVALLFRTGNHYRVDAVGPWSGGCGPTPPRFLSVADRFGFVEEDNNNDDEGLGHTLAVVRVPRDDHFDTYSGILTGRNPWSAEELGAPYVRMTGYVTEHRLGFAVKETWQRSGATADAGDGSSGLEVLSREVVYRIQGDRAVPSQTEPPF